LKKESNQQQLQQKQVLRENQWLNQTVDVPYEQFVPHNNHTAKRINDERNADPYLFRVHATASDTDWRSNKYQHRHVFGPASNQPVYNDKENSKPVGKNRWDRVDRDYKPPAGLAYNRINYQPHPQQTMQSVYFTNIQNNSNWVSAPLRDTSNIQPLMRIGQQQQQQQDFIEKEGLDTQVAMINSPSRFEQDDGDENNRKQKRVFRFADKGSKWV
jgi:hypothetical protein